MQLRKVGMHEVVKDKAMENGLQDMDDEKLGRRMVSDHVTT